MKPIILIKLGGSIITDKSRPFTANHEAITRLVREVKAAMDKRDYASVLGTGAGSFGHVPANQYCLVNGNIDDKTREGVALTHNAVSQLNLLVTTQLIEHGVNAISISPASFLLAKRGHISEGYLRPIDSFLTLGLTPVVYGDVVADGGGGYSVVSTDTIITYLAKELFSKGYMIKNVIHVGTTDGVYDTDKKTIPTITSRNYEEVKQQIGISKDTDVTGGMAFKVKEALELAKGGIETVIINGTRERELVRAVMGGEVKGTVIKND